MCALAYDAGSNAISSNQPKSNARLCCVGHRGARASPNVFIKHSSSRTRLRSIGVPSTPTIGRPKLNPHDVSELVIDALGTLPARTTTQHRCSRCSHRVDFCASPCSVSLKHRLEPQGELGVAVVLLRKRARTTHPFQNAQTFCSNCSNCRVSRSFHGASQPADAHTNGLLGSRG